MAEGAFDQRIRSDYDAVPYLSGAFRESHPDSLATTAKIAGFACASPTDCRVLEVGCAVGGNLLPMAQGLPRSRFLGIDISPKQIERAVELARRAGLENVQFRCQDLSNFSKDEGEFDYIIAHGVYSWVPDEIRSSLLRLIGQNLAPRGLAYVSYNTLPGHYLTQIARDLMMFHTPRDLPWGTRAARGRQILQWASQPSAVTIPGYEKVIRASWERISKVDDWSLLHDELEIVNQAFYFSEFVRALESHELQHLASADPATEFRERLPREAKNQAEAFSADPIAREQYLDFLEGLPFRRSVLCRRAAMQSSHRAVEAMPAMYVAAELNERPAYDSGAKTVSFVHKSGAILSFAEPVLIEAARRIARAWPHAVSFPELCKAGGASSPTEGLLAHQLFHNYKEGFVELWTRPTDFLATDMERPCTTPLVRVQAQMGGLVATMRHENFSLGQAGGIISLMDGSRTRDELAHEVGRLFEQGRFHWSAPNPSDPTQDLRQMIDGMVNELAAQSLLVKPN